MAYNGRKAFDQTATDNGWNIYPGGALVAYERYSTQILIDWSAENTATVAVKNYQCDDQEVAKGVGLLVTASAWLKA